MYELVLVFASYRRIAVALGDSVDSTRLRIYGFLHVLSSFVKTSCLVIRYPLGVAAASCQGFALLRALRDPTFFVSSWPTLTGT